MAVSAAVMALGLASVAHAAMTEETQAQPDGVRSHLTSDATAQHDQADGTVYGVMARAPNSAPSTQILPFDSDQARSATAAATPGFDNLDNWLASGPYENFTPFATAARTPLGLVTASGYAVDIATPRLLSADRHEYDLRDFQLTASLMPGVRLDAGYNLDLAGRFNDYAAMASPAYDGLFFSASGVNSPYLGLTDGGSYVGSSFALGGGLQFRIGTSSVAPNHRNFAVPFYSMADQLLGPQSEFDRRRAQSTVAGLDWNFAKWGGLGLVASQTDEQNGLLGGIDSGALSITRSAKTTAVGLSARLGFGDGWVTTFSYNEGITQLNLRPDNILPHTGTLRSRSYGIAVAKHGLFSDSDTLGLALTQPIHVYSGNVDINAATGVDASNLFINHGRVSLAPGTPETDVELGYVTTFLDGALALQANAGYQMNLAGQKGTNSVTVLSRAKINF